MIGPGVTPETDRLQLDPTASLGHVAQSALEWAARLLVLGVNVIPLNGKIPRGPWARWQDERQIDLPMAEGDAYLLEDFTGEVNVGAVTGAVSGIVVVDTDSTDGWEALEAACGGRVPRTVMVNTAKGRHVWFVHPGGTISNRARVDGVELDVRGDGGYVVCPPSIHTSSVPYTWIRSPLDMWPPAAMPERLLAMLRPEPVARPHVALPTPTSSAYVERALQNELEAIATAPVGGRNDQLNRSVFSLARFVDGGSLSAVELAAAALDAARVAGLPEREAASTIDSALGGRLG